MRRPSFLRTPMGRRRDPAPSIWAYRYQRLMLTPVYRRLLRVGVPAGAVTLAALLWLASDANRAALTSRIEAIKTAVQERPQFMITERQITGADRTLAAAINEVVQIDLPVSSFDLDLDGVLRGVTALTAVRSAEVRIHPGGRLEIAVDQRVPVAVWRHADGLRLIDTDGVMTGMISDRSARADLPLIAGDGAKDAIDEAMDLFATAAPIAPRVRGLVRMGERRWDMVLSGDVRILLPAEDAVAALQRVLALHDAQDLLDRDLSIVDMRLGERPTLRLNASALARLKPELVQLR